MPGPTAAGFLARIFGSAYSPATEKSADLNEKASNSFLSSWSNGDVSTFNSSFQRK